MKNAYKESTLREWTKEELIEYIICLQNNLKNEEHGNTHMYKVITAAMHKDDKLSKVCYDILDTWNKSFGHRYLEIDDPLAKKGEE